MRLENSKVAGKRRRLNCKPPQPTLAVVVRQQTTDERQRYQTALDVLLREMVRQQIGRWRK